MSEPAERTLTSLADAAFREAAAKLMRRARETGTPLILWEDGEIRSVPPEELKEGIISNLPLPMVPDPA